VKICNIEAMLTLSTTHQLTPLRPSVRPMAIKAPVMVCVVDTGRPAGRSKHVDGCSSMQGLVAALTGSSGRKYNRCCAAVPHMLDQVNAHDTVLTIAGGNGDSDGRAELSREAASEGDLGNLHAEGLGDVAGEQGQAAHNTNTTNDQDPLLHVDLLICVQTSQQPDSHPIMTGRWAAEGPTLYMFHDCPLPASITFMRSLSGHTMVRSAAPQDRLRTLLEIWPVLQIWYTPAKGPMALATSLAPCTKDMAHAENTYMCMYLVVCIV
jgi:hypothetical protein